MLCTVGSIIKWYQVVTWLLHCTSFWLTLRTTDDRDCPPTDRNIPAMTEITLHNIASVFAIWLVDKPLHWHLTSIFGKRTVNVFGMYGTRPWDCGIPSKHVLNMCLKFDAFTLLFVSSKSGNCFILLYAILCYIAPRYIESLEYK